MGKLIFSIICFVLALWGYVQEYPHVIIIAEIIFSVLCVGYDVSKGYKNISFITFYSLFTLFYCTGNLVTVLSLGTPDEIKYNLYLYRDGIDEGLFLLLIGNIALVVGFEIYQIYRPFNKIFVTRDLDFRVSDKVINYIIALLAIYYFLEFVPIINLPFFLKLLPYPTIFFLVRYTVSKEQDTRVNILILLVLIQSVHGLMYGYLRAEIVDGPIIFFAAYYLGKPKLSNFFKLKLVPLYAVVFLFISIFAFLGEIRSSAMGAEKLDIVLAKLLGDSESNDKETAAVEADDYSVKGNFLSRISNINQVSQLVRVTMEDGYYMGRTMAYFSYAFVPRFLWPDKPAIAQGQWFALRIGLAYMNEYGQINNSVNMTTSGEMYLNFGFIGVFTGLFIIGILFSYFWKTTRLWDSVDNILGTFYALFLISLAMTSMGADSQFLVTQISYFIAIQIVNALLNIYWKRA